MFQKLLYEAESGYRYTSLAYSVKLTSVTAAVRKEKLQSNLDNQVTFAQLFHWPIFVLVLDPLLYFVWSTTIMPLSFAHGWYIIVVGRQYI